MHPERWRKIVELYYAALECDPKDRAAFLDRHEPDARREVEDLLAQEGLLSDRKEPLFDLHALKFPGDATDAMFAPFQRPALPASVPAADLFEARFLPGTMVAHRYRIVNLLGRGGMGEVYRAMDLTLGQTIALKFLPDAIANKVQSRERFFNEVRVARKITHPQVCRVHDIGEVDGQFYISMEFVDGEDLASLRIWGYANSLRVLNK